MKDSVFDVAHLAAPSKIVLHFSLLQFKEFGFAAECLCRYL